MKQYPKYKDSGIEWIGEVPEEWTVTRVKYLTTHNVEYGLNISSENYVPEGIRFVRTTDINEHGELSTEGVYLSKNDVSEDYLLNKGDFLISRSGTIGRAYVHHSNISQFSYAGYLVRFRFRDINISQYLFYVTKSHEFLSWLRSNSIESTIGNVNGQKYANLSLAFPTDKNELIKIVTYLNYKTHQIDTLIENKQQLIDLLKEQRAAIINQAVTRGLNPDVKLKDSGIEWLGEIPEHWDVKKLKYFAMINPTKDNSLLSKDSGTLVTFLPMEMVNEDGTFITDMKKPIKELWNGFTYFEENDTIVAKITPCFENGKGAFLENLDSMIGFGSTEFHVLREIPDVSISKYLYYITRTNLFRKMGEAFMTGAAGQKRVPTNFIDDFIIGLPSVGEQREITDYLDEQTTRIDKLMEKQERQIEHLKEYRTALISEVVTGKIDVIDSEIQEVIHS